MDKSEDLALRRGRLLERIAHQRAAIATAVAPLEQVCSRYDQGVGFLQGLGAGLARHPYLVTAAAAVLVMLRPGRVWRWTRRGLIFWQALRALGDYISPPNPEASSLSPLGRPWSPGRSRGWAHLAGSLGHLFVRSRGRR